MHRSFERTDSGFHPESGFFCQRDGTPFPTLFSRNLYLLFAGEDREHNATQLIEGFRARPVKFILGSWRLNQFPDAVRQFWIDHYQPYRASVSIPGRRLSGERQQRIAFALIVQKYFIRPEEAALERLFGEEYTSYKSRVRMWL